MKLVQNFMLFLPVPLASPLGEEGVHSCAGTITVTPAYILPFLFGSDVPGSPQATRASAALSHTVMD